MELTFNRSFHREALIRGDSPRERLFALRDSRAPVTIQPTDLSSLESELELLQNSLGKVGFTTAGVQRSAKRIRLLLIFGSASTGAFLGLCSGKPFLTIIGAALFGYIGLMAWLAFLRLKERRFNQNLLFYAPLVLESIILLVESGLGVLPAIEQLLRQARPNPVIDYLRIAYNYTEAGVPFADSLELVADSADQRIIRHVFLHLDISGNEGGELIPSLRSLSGYAQTEWKLAVEERVKRLENLVVFPVFVSVIGLMLLTAAVPLVPVLELRDQLRDSRAPLTTKSDDPSISKRGL